MVCIKKRPHKTTCGRSSASHFRYLPCLLDKGHITPYSGGLFVVGIVCFFGLIAFGLLCNIIAMKFYPLTKEKMEEIQDKIAAIKVQAQ